MTTKLDTSRSQTLRDGKKQAEKEEKTAFRHTHYMGRPYTVASELGYITQIRE